MANRSLKAGTGQNDQLMAGFAGFGEPSKENVGLEGTSVYSTKEMRQARHLLSYAHDNPFSTLSTEEIYSILFFSRNQHIVRIQRQPSFHELIRLACPVWEPNICQSDDCFRPGGAILANEVRLCIEEDPTTASPATAERPVYLHLMCLERHLDWLIICQNLKVVVEYRPVYIGQRRVRNLLQLGSDAEVSEAVLFVMRCKARMRPHWYPMQRADMYLGSLAYAIYQLRECLDMGRRPRQGSISEFSDVD